MFWSPARHRGELTEIPQIAILSEGIGQAEFQRSPVRAILNNRGGIAQLGERYNRTVEVGGSSPPASTTAIANSDLLRP